MENVRLLADIWRCGQTKCNVCSGLRKNLICVAQNDDCPDPVLLINIITDTLQHLQGSVILFIDGQQNKEKTPQVTKV
jgi:hypothetical protein